ncbi:hypothetical protein YB2330_001061 [Saitoella coloradoensis]
MSTINIFEPQTILTAVSTTTSKDPLIITLTPTLEGNFFTAAPKNDVTCYRRNYFAPCLLITANAPPETWIIRGSTGQFKRVQSVSVQLTARMSSNPTKPVPLVQQTSRKDTTGGNPPDPLPVEWNVSRNERCMVESKSLTWKRMQFKSATAKNTRTKSSTSSEAGTTTYRGENYSLVLTLIATTLEEVHVPLIEVNSVPICVRGRSAWFYADSATQPIPGVKSQAERWAGMIPNMSSSSNAASASGTGTVRGGKEGVPVPVPVPQAGWFSNNTPVAGQQSVNYGLGSWTGTGNGVSGTGMLTGNARSRPQPSSLNFSSSLPDYTGGAYSPMNTSTTNAWTPAVFDLGSGSAYPAASITTMPATPTSMPGSTAGLMSPPTNTSMSIPTSIPTLRRHPSSDFSSSSGRTGSRSLSRMSTQEERDMDMDLDMDIPAPDLSPHEKPKWRSLSLPHGTGGGSARGRDVHHMTPPTVPSMLQRHSISTIPEDQSSMSVSQQTGTIGGGGGGEENGTGSGGEGGGEGDGDAYIFYPMDARYALPPVDVVYLPHAGHCHRDTSTGEDGGVGYMYSHGRGFGQGG